MLKSAPFENGERFREEIAIAARDRTKNLKKVSEPPSGGSLIIKIKKAFEELVKLGLVEPTRAVA